MCVAGIAFDGFYGLRNVPLDVPFGPHYIRVILEWRYIGGGVLWRRFAGQWIALTTQRSLTKEYAPTRFSYGWFYKIDIGIVV